MQPVNWKAYFLFGVAFKALACIFAENKTQGLSFPLLNMHVHEGAYKMVEKVVLLFEKVKLRLALDYQNHLKRQTNRFSFVDLGRERGFLSKTKESERS